MLTYWEVKYSHFNLVPKIPVFGFNCDNDEDYRYTNFYFNAIRDLYMPNIKNISDSQIYFDYYIKCIESALRTQNE